MAAPRSVVGSSRLGVGPQNAGQMIGAMPLYQGSTNYGVLGANSGTYGNTPSGSGSEYVDQYGTKFRYVDYGNGTGEWLQVTQSGALVKPQDAAAADQRDPFRPTQGASIQGTRSAGNVGATPGNNFMTPAGGQRSVQMAGGTGIGMPQGGSTAITPQGTAGPNYTQQYNDLLNDQIQSDNNWYTGQKQRDDSYLGQLSGLVGGANAADTAALGKYQSSMAPIISGIQGLQAPTWQDYNSNPADVQRQMQAFDWAQGAANGSLDYQAALANYQTADYQTYQAQQAALQLAQLHQYASDPTDVQRQLTGLGNIEKDLQSGGDGQRKILADIYKDLQSGGDGQRDAIARLKQELATGGTDQREVLEKYKALSNPEVTAQERYLAEIARRSFESQDRSNREAQLQDLSMRGLRSGGAEIASALANQERLGQDRTQAELGLQANAVGRSMQALGGWQQSADSLRAAQQTGLAMYTQAQNALRQAQQNGMALAANEENALRQAQQQGLAMYQNAANAIRDMNDRVGLANTGWANENSMFNANAFNQNQQFNANATNQARQFNANAYNENSMFNANAFNQNSMFNANSINTTNANNQSTRVQGGVAMNNTANSIRSMNDAIGMFNTSGSQASQQFAAQFGLQKGQTLGGFAQQDFGNTTGVTQGNLNRSTGLAATNWSIPSATEEQQRQNRAATTQSRGIQLAQAALAAKRPGTVIGV